MDLDVIKSLIEALAASDLAEMEYHSNGETLRLVKRRAGTLAPPHPAPPAAPGPEPAPVSMPPPPFRESEALPGTIVAPLYGIVYLQQTPDGPPLAIPGQIVKAGQVLCIIEAMKVFNQVRAECDCLVAEVLVQSGEEVEAGQTLFRLAEISASCSIQS